MYNKLSECNDFYNRNVTILSCLLFDVITLSKFDAILSVVPSGVVLHHDKKGTQMNDL